MEILSLYFISLVCNADTHLSSLNDAPTVYRKPLVIALSGATQGNGYNMPATLGWLYNSLNMTYEEGLLLQKKIPNTEILVDISSFGGSSSGSAVTNIFDALLKNESIISEELKRNDGLLKLEALDRLAKSVQFIALGSNFSHFFRDSTVVRAARENIRGILQKIVSKIPFLAPFLEAKTPDIWSQQMNGEVVISDFGRLVYTAQTITWESVTRPIEHISGYEHWASVRSKNAALNRLLASVTKISDFIVVANENENLIIEPNEHKIKGEVYDSNTLKLVQKFQKWQVGSIKKIISESIHQKISRFTDLTRRFGSGMTPHSEKDKKQENPFKEVLAESLRDGFLVTVMGVLFNSQSEMKSSIKSKGNRIDYKDFRNFIMASETTIQTLLNSDYYQREIKNGNPILSRYILVVIDQRWAGMNISAREPRLLRELAGPLDSEQIRFKKYYDPKMDQNTDFILQQTGQSENKDKTIFVAGGFPSQEINSWFPGIYFKHRVTELESIGYQVEPRFFMFGRDLQVNEKSFSTDTIADFFSNGDSNQAKANIADWNHWSLSARAALGQILNSISGTFLETRARWDFQGKKLPMMLTDLTPSVYARIVNVAQKVSLKQFIHDFGELVPAELYQKHFDSHPELIEVEPVNTSIDQHLDNQNSSDVIPTQQEVNSSECFKKLK